LKKGKDFGFGLFEKGGMVGLSGFVGLRRLRRLGGLRRLWFDERRFENTKGIVDVFIVVRVAMIVFRERRRWR